MAIDTSPSQLQQPGPQTLGSNVVSFLGLMLRAQEAKAEAPAREAATRLTAARATGLEQENTLFDNLQKKLPDLLTEYGQIKTAEDMFKFNGKYGNLMASPPAAKIMNFLNDTAWKTFEYETKTMDGQIKAARAKYVGNLALRFPDLDVTTPEGLAQAQERAKTIAPTAGGLPLEEIKFDDAGNPVATYSRTRQLLGPNDIGFNQTELPSGHIVLQNSATGAIHVIDATRKTTAAHLAAFRADDAAFQKQLTGVENDLLMRVNPEKKAQAIAEIQKQRAASQQKYLGELLKTEAPPAVASTPATTVAPAATPTIQQDKALILQDARNALIKGAPRDKVIERLRELGITEEP